MIDLLLRKQTLARSLGLCPACDKKIEPNPDSFRNAISYREYRMSGLCQECQDEVFGKD